jgi:hypothetical protein
MNVWLPWNGAGLRQLRSWPLTSLTIGALYTGAFCGAQAGAVQSLPVMGSRVWIANGSLQHWHYASHSLSFEMLAFSPRWVLE